MCIYFSSNQWAESADEEHGLTFHFCIQVKWFVISFFSAGSLVRLTLLAASTESIDYNG